MFIPAQHGLAQLALLSSVRLEQRPDGIQVWWPAVRIMEPPDALQVHLHLRKQQPGPRQLVKVTDAWELVEAGLSRPRRTGHIGVEQLSHVPPEHKCRNDAVPSSLTRAFGR